MLKNGPETKDYMEKKMKEISDHLKEEYENTFHFYSPSTLDRYNGRLKVLSRARSLFDNIYLAPESAVNIWSRFSRSTDLIFGKMAPIMAYIRLAGVGMAKKGLISTDWKKELYLEHDIRETLSIMCDDNIAPDYIKMSKQNDPNLEYYEAWRDTVSEIQKFISGLNIPLRRYPDYTGKYKLYSAEGWSHLLKDESTSFIRKSLFSDSEIQNHTLIWLEITEEGKHIDKLRMCDDENASYDILNYSLTSKLVLMDFIQSEIFRLIKTKEYKTGPVASGYISSLTSFRRVLMNEEVDERKIIKILSDMNVGKSLLYSPLATQKNGDKSYSTPNNLFQSICRSNMIDNYTNDVGFFNPNMTALIRLFHYYNAFPYSEKDEERKDREEGWWMGISNIAMVIFNQDVKNDFSDGYFASPEYEWDSLFYKDLP